MSFMQLAVNRVIRGQKELQEHVTSAIDLIEKHENIDEAFTAYCVLLTASVIPYNDYTASDPFSECAPGVQLNSPYDDLYMDRGVTKGWEEIYSILDDNPDVDDSLLQDWKRAIIKSRTTHFRYDW